MNWTPKGTKQKAYIGITTRCFNVGERQAVQPIVLIHNNKSKLERVSATIVKKVRC